MTDSQNSPGNGSNCTTMGGTLTVSLRESRLVLDRLLLQTALPPGYNSAVRECILMSEAMGLGGYAALQKNFDTLRHANPLALALTHVQRNGETALSVSCGGQHAWVAGQILLDLLVDLACNDDGSLLLVEDIAAPAELAVLSALALRQGAEVEIDGITTHRAQLRLKRIRMPATGLTDAMLWKVIRQGLPVEAALWWALYRLSLQALAPDSVVSRRHAGANMVDENGKVVGRLNDDDTDFSLLKSVAAAPHS